MLIGFGCTNHVNNKVINSVSIIYDSGNILRPVRVETNDLIRWSKDLKKNHFKDTVITKKESLKLFQDFIESITVDSTTMIQTVTQPTTLSMSCGMTISYYNDPDDIQADGMIIYHYDGDYKNDSVFINLSRKCRFNNYKATCDTTLLREIFLTYNIGYTIY